MKYSHLLKPALYPDKYCADLVTTMNQTTIMATERLAELKKTFPSTDELLDYVEVSEKKAQSQFLQTGIVLPTFTIYQNKEPLSLQFPTPTNQQQIEDLHLAGKCFAYIHCAPFMLFSTSAPYKKDEVLIGQVDEDADMGIYVGGSSMKGNAFYSLTRITDHKMVFQNVKRHILKEKDARYPINHLFSIKNAEEMSKILKCIPKVIKLCPELNENTCIVNFLATLKALACFNYQIC